MGEGGRRCLTPRPGASSELFLPRREVRSVKNPGAGKGEVPRRAVVPGPTRDRSKAAASRADYAVQWRAQATSGCRTGKAVEWWAANGVAGFPQAPWHPGRTAPSAVHRGETSPGLAGPHWPAQRRARTANAAAPGWPGAPADDADRAGSGGGSLTHRRSPTGDSGCATTPPSGGGPSRDGAAPAGARGGGETAPKLLLRAAAGTGRWTSGDTHEYGRGRFPFRRDRGTLRSTCSNRAYELASASAGRRLRRRWGRRLQ